MVREETISSKTWQEIEVRKKDWSQIITVQLLEKMLKKRRNFDA